MCRIFTKAAISALVFASCGVYDQEVSDTSSLRPQVQPPHRLIAEDGADLTLLKGLMDSFGSPIFKKEVSFDDSKVRPALLAFSRYVVEGKEYLASLTLKFDLIAMGSDLPVVEAKIFDADGNEKLVIPVESAANGQGKYSVQGAVSNIPLILKNVDEPLMYRLRLLINGNEIEDKVIDLHGS